MQRFEACIQSERRLITIRLKRITGFCFGLLFLQKQQSPLEESHAVAGGTIPDLDALIGVFVSSARVSAAGFSAIDGAKDITAVGLPPSDLFFVGTGRTITVTIPGTLFLGINDLNGQDNGGEFTVSVPFTPAT
jgi:hypothetical protein